MALLSQLDTIAVCRINFNSNKDQPHNVFVENFYHPADLYI